MPYESHSSSQFLGVTDHSILLEKRELVCFMSSLIYSQNVLLKIALVSKIQLTCAEVEAHWPCDCMVD